MTTQIIEIGAKFNISDLGVQLGINWLEIARGRIREVPVGGRKSVKC